MVGLGIGYGSEQENAFGVAIEGGLAKSLGVIGLGVREGDEQLDAFDMAALSREAERARAVMARVGP